MTHRVSPVFSCLDGTDTGEEVAPVDKAMPPGTETGQRGVIMAAKG